MAVSTAQINDALTTILGAAAGLKRAVSFDELTEGMNDTPYLEVYFETWENDITNATTDRTTYRGGVEQCQIIYHADLYGSRRSNIGDDMGTVLPVVDQIIDILQAQKTKPYFNLTGIRAFHWTAQRAVFERADATYLGVRFIITIRVF